MPDFIPCHAFGGGWLTADSDDARDICEGIMGEPAAFVPPIGREGWIVEPHDAPYVLMALEGESA